jgi:hypothetical protein
MRVSGQRHAPATLYPQYPRDRRLGGWASEPVWTQTIEEKSFASDGDRTPTVQCGQIVLKELPEFPPRAISLSFSHITSYIPEIDLYHAMFA